MQSTHWQIYPVYRRQLFTVCLTVKAPEIVSIKKICDGFEITVCDFFDSSLFDETEQGIK